MWKQQDLTNTEAIAKLKDLAEDIRMCMFVTHTTNWDLHSRPMSTQQVDEQGNIWFFSSKQSNKNHEIQQGSHAHLYYMDKSANHYVSIKWSVTISQDKAMIDKLWNSFIAAWFPDGKDDHNLTLLCVKPHEGYYRDTQYGTMITLLMIAASAITNKHMDGSLEGELSV